jgi:KUP system potassium uptake protein
MSTQDTQAPSQPAGEEKTLKHGMSIRSRRRAQPHEPHPPARGRALALLAVTALGVVYGDIGTSPLYALRECFHGPKAIAPTRENIFGVLSLIFWSLIIVITIKYVVFILRANNRGEGGILALTALATPVRQIAMSRQRWLVLLGVFGAALLYGDGVITPAISVLSAVEGLKVATPLFEPFVIPITLVILIALFMVQRGGTARIGAFFGPIMVVWFAVLALLGISHIVQYPAVLTAINPLDAVGFFAANGWQGFLVLGTVFLVVTGGEALYADMGHFGPRPIRWAWFTYVLPALLLNYFGQGSLLLRNPEAAENAFYLRAPSWALYPLVVLATMATIIASQALISGAFSLTMQANNLGFLPRMRILHTSESAFGQIYIPSVNWALMVACIAVVIFFGTSSNLAAAYGIAVTSTMVITTIIFAVVARKRWHWGLPKLVPIVTFFLVVDSAFFGANLVKIPDGGWFPLIVAGLIFAIMTTWKRGSWLVVVRERGLEMTLPRLLTQLESRPPVRTPGDAVFLSANPAGTPAALLTNLRYNGVLHQRVLLVSVQFEEFPYVAAEDRVIVEPLGQDVFQVLIRYGFMEEPDVPAALKQITLPDRPFDADSAPYFVNRTRVVVSDAPGMAPWREQLYTVMRRNATSAADFFVLPPNQVFEIGTTIEM